jgi:hypothetical protein
MKPLWRQIVYFVVALACAIAVLVAADLEGEASSPAAKAGAQSNPLAPVR